MGVILTWVAAGELGVLDLSNGPLSTCCDTL